MVSSVATSHPQTSRSAAPWVALGVILVILIGFKAGSGGIFSEGYLTLSIREPIDAAADWISQTFQFLLKPSSTAVKAALKVLDEFATGLPWPVVFIAVMGFCFHAAGWGLAVFAGLCLAFMGVTGLWASSLVTINLMLVSVAVTVIVGVPLGIVMAASDRSEAVIRPILDTMQTLPVFVYLIPVLLLFGLGAASAIVATFIYALPPIVRMTNLGLRQIPPNAVEAAISAGPTEWQLLWKIRMPLARPSILLGFNQTVMMALSMVIFVALIGASGLGRDVWFAMRQLKIADALEAGIAVVLLAILLDRLGYAVSQKRSGAAAPGTGFLIRHRVLAACVGAIAVILGVHWLGGGIGGFPTSWKMDLMWPVEVAVRWLTIVFSDANDALRATTLIYGVLPARAALSWIPIPVVVVSVGYLGWMLGDRRLGVGAAVGLAAIAVMGVWGSMVVTLSQVIVALVVTLMIGLPLGVISAKSDRFEALLRPVLDTLQTMPAFVYFPVIVMFYKVGEFSGIVATVIYALAPAVRMTSLGLRQIPSETREAAICCGSTARQMLFKIELPLAAPSVLVGINQTTMMCLAMVVYAGLIGAPGLGADVLRAIGRFDIGGGFEVGIAIVILAIVIDRFTAIAAKSLSHS
jgi:glycine betaine/proline transport system permease protein